MSQKEGNKEVTKSLNFIESIIEEDLRINKNESCVRTRFPPEPNGYLHIGHAKSICLNFGLANNYNGLCNLRFDDTNPTKEEEEYVNSIIEDVKWLGFDWEDRLYYASDYFEQLYDWAEKLILDGNAYVDDQTAEEIGEQRGGPTRPGTKSPFRDREPEANLELFRRMKNGDFEDGARVLRAKIDMASPNMHMRDPVIYRIMHSPMTAQVTNGASIPCMILPTASRIPWKASPTPSVHWNLKSTVHYMTGSWIKLIDADTGRVKSNLRG